MATNQIINRNEEKIPYNIFKIKLAILKALDAIDNPDIDLADYLTKKVDRILSQEYFEKEKLPTIDNIQDIIEDVLIKEGLTKLVKAYVIYRKQHDDLRQMSKLIDSINAVESYINISDWQVKENSNMDYSLQGLNNYLSTKVISDYWIKKIYPPEIKEAHEKRQLHIHDLNTLGPYCVGWDLQSLLQTGFRGGPGKIVAAPPKHLDTALGQIVNFIYTLQGEAAGAQAFSNFDTLLAPFIYYDKLDYKQTRAAIEKFVYNMNVPTRVGYQCMSEDTEILTEEGWKTHDDIKVGDIIKTFNIKTGKIEDLPIKKLFVREYSGKMYNIKNKIQDQLISPNHRMVRQTSNSKNKFVLEEVEKVMALKSPIILPIAADTNYKGIAWSDEKIKLVAWLIARGCSEQPHHKNKNSRNIKIYQSEIKNNKDNKEIKNLLNHFNLKYSESKHKALGMSVNYFKINAEGSRLLHSWFDDESDIKFIPVDLFKANQKQARLFLETYNKVDGTSEFKISTTSVDMLYGLQHMCVLAGYGFTTCFRKPTIGKKPIFILKIIQHKDTTITCIKEVNYKGKIWCPNTDNETVIAKRNGKVFITGNTPFSNITLDLTVPSTLKDQAVIIGGKPQDKTYGEFQKEMDIFNAALLDIFYEGDAAGNIFSFPIPTINVTKDFDWDSPLSDKLLELTIKYGTPYFANFVNSDMKPEDARSMCCRLRLDNRELQKRGGGLFGSNPLTGSIGVVTINLAQIGYLAKTEEEYFEKLGYLMDLSKKSLDIKRKIVEKYTDDGLYPYSKFNLKLIKDRFGSYWKNHFSTIGLLGMNESCLNFLGEPITTPKGNVFANKVMDFMRERIQKYQEETGALYNLEATPGEGTTYRFASHDKAKFPSIIVANEENVQKNGAQPYYTNSTQVPVNYTNDIFEILELQDELQCKYTGGTVIHFFIGEKKPSKEAIKSLIKKITTNYKLPYFTFTPTFSICPKHGYLFGEHEYCPKCDAEIGYLSKSKN
ncbi:MAG TPA: ribonucleoside triphosphate reductase [archaeon]|jgi:ribonucleoside-triphosphate reductase|nr:ribonucleoside triphosphate reductase [archaeon]HPV66061.1 ribonucleoside triphosphate reductase [archaeon]